MSIPAEVHALVERFDRNLTNYKRGKYNEAQVRREFIDPFFKAIGWDIDNTKGYAEPYKEVVHEDAIKVGRATKAPDYSFRIGGVRKFFLEAKKPSVDIKHGTHPAYQLRRYAWSAKLPLSILTDFEEFAVYDCRIKPVKTDQAAVARVMYLTYKDYINHWPELIDIFSPESIRKGSFDKYVETKKAKRGTAEVDNAFLQEIERWRDVLAHNFALRNTLPQRQLNYTVQQTIDRLIFLRIAEDRGIESYGRLRKLLDGDDVYPHLFELFQRADDKYNSGLFHFKPEKGRETPDTLTPHLKLDDKVLKDIIQHLYYPDSPYELSVLPADILGQVYEQFLGKVIRLTPKGRAVVEDKPEVKKAGGVYYTPTYIVDYIVQQTVGKLVEGQTPGQLSGKNTLRVLDPACGSGSFLLGAYQYLLDWHLAWYVNNNPDKWAKRKNAPIYPAPTTDPNVPNWKLTVDERKRILLSHIYGVDVDPQAVEVTKLSLLLKVLEDEQSVAQQLGLFQERVLPDLDDNIKCGNALIGYDFYDGQQMGFFDEEEQYRINAFDWQTEFAEVMQDGGFDAVIGNPPYIDSEWMTQFLPECREYCVSRYQAASGNWDIFCVFIEKAIRLCKPRGLTSMIVPNKLGSAGYAAGVRDVLAKKNLLISIRDYSHVPVFPVSVYPIVYVARRVSPKQNSLIEYERMGLSPHNTTECVRRQKLEYARYFADHHRPWPIFSDIHKASPVERLQRQFPTLESVADVLGAATVSEAYEIQSLIHECPDENTSELKMINSGTIDRYNSLWGHKNFRYLGDTYLRPIIPLNQKKNLPKKRRQQAEQPKIIVAGMTKVLECTVDLEGSTLAGKSTSIILSSLDLKYLVGLLNSRLITLYYQSIFGGNKMQGGYLRIGPPQLRKLPIRTINFDDPADKASHDQMVALVEQMLNLHQQLNQPQTPQAKTMLKRQIEATDRQIDKLVYELYGLTDEEIKIVEG